MASIGLKGYCIIHPAVVTVEATYLANQKEQGIPRALVVTARGLYFTPNDPSISLGMDIDFAATKSHIMSKETPKMKKAFMKLCTDVEGSLISLSFKIPRTWYVPWCCCQCSCKAEAIKSTWPATTSAQPLTNFVQALDYWCILIEGHTNQDREGQETSVRYRPIRLGRKWVTSESFTKKTLLYFKSYTSNLYGVLSEHKF